MDEHNIRVLSTISHIIKELYVDQSILSTPDFQAKLKLIQNINADGFEHGDLSSKYSYFLNDPRYKSVRLFGWSAIFKILAQNAPDPISNTQLIIDFLAGSGTLAKRIKLLWQESNRPSVIGIDISKRMSNLAFERGETVFWGSHDTHILKDGVADYAVAAHGFHHVPQEEHHAFILSMHKSLKRNGICLIQDYEFGTPTAEFYSKCVDKYRLSGHPDFSFTEQSLINLMNPYFKKLNIYRVYDPFYLEGKEDQCENSLEREAYCYLLSLYNLKKLIPSTVDIEQVFSYHNEGYWRYIKDLLLPFFKFSQKEIKDLHDSFNKYEVSIPFIESTKIPIVASPTIIPISVNRHAIVFPRSCLVCVGIK